MRAHIVSGIAVAVLGMTAHQASASITFAFGDRPNSDGQFSYSAPAGSRAAGLLTYDSTVSVNLEVDGTGEGGTAFEYPDVIFSFTADVGEFDAAPVPGMYLAPLTHGAFSFKTAAEELLFQGSFGEVDPAYLVIVGNTGAINVSSLLGGLALNAGGKLGADLTDPERGGLTGVAAPNFATGDATWTLSNFPALSTRFINNGHARGVFLEDFTANASYSGSGQLTLPAPAALGAMSLVSAFFGVRRKR